MQHKLPILILSAPRTGSTALGEYFKQKYNVDQFIIEPDYHIHAAAGEMEKFNELFYRTKNFIIKFHYYHMHLYDEKIIKSLLEDSYKIRIRRKDVVKQIASLYIARQRGDKWHFKINIQLNDKIEINEYEILFAIDLIKDANQQLDNCNIEFDEDMWYEDLPNIDATGFRRTPAPRNYNEIVAEITKHL